MPMHRTLLFSFLAVAVLLPATSASARSSVRIGIADQSPAMFDSSYFQQLKIKRTRYFVPSDVMQDGAERAKARAFVQAARRAKVSTMLHISTTDLREKRGRVVSATSYRRNVGRIVAYFRKLGVREFGAWNEVNHKTQETWNRVGNAVAYYKSMYSAIRRRCRTCTVVGLDLLDQAGVDRYIRSFYARLSRTWRRRLKVVGIHNYSDVNRKRMRGTRGIIRAVRRYNRRAKFWLTETGGMAYFATTEVVAFPCSESRQARAVGKMFRIARKYRRYIKRLYPYNFYGTDCDRSLRFDAGLIRRDGSRRPAFETLRRAMRRFRR